MTDTVLPPPPREDTTTESPAIPWIERVITLLDTYPMTSDTVSIHMFPTVAEIRALTTEAGVLIHGEHTRLLAERIEPHKILRAIASIQRITERLKSHMRSLKHTMYKIDLADREHYTTFLNWLYHARSGEQPTHQDTYGETSLCMAPTKQKRRCKQTVKNGHGTHLPGTCAIHTPGHAEFVTWLNTEDGAHLPHAKETISMWGEECRIVHGMEELYEQCEALSNMSTVAHTAVPTEIQVEWDRYDQIKRAHERMDRAVEHYDALCVACHEWAIDNHPMCPVCMEFLPKDRKGTVKLPCGHDLCITCFKGMNRTHHRSNSNCPVCRAVIT